MALFGTIAVEVGCLDFKVIGNMTFDQMIAVLKGIRLRKESMWGGLAGEPAQDGTEALERKLAHLKATTGKDTFDLFQVAL